MIVVNATVLSNLSRVDRLGILKELYGNIVIPIQVYEEILQGISEGYCFLETVDKVAEEGWTVFEAPTSKEGRKCFKELLVSVDYGEAAGIAVAKEQGLLFFSDDKKARQVAKEQGLEVSGTLGSLKPARQRSRSGEAGGLAVEEGMISIEEADKVLGEMIRGGYRSPIESMKELFESEEEGRD